MHKLILAMFVLVIVLALVTNSRIVISALAVSSGVAGPVIQEAVNTVILSLTSKSTNSMVVFLK